MVGAAAQIAAVRCTCASRTYPLESMWKFMSDNWLSNRIFKSHDEIVHQYCMVWNKLIDQPWYIMTIGHRKWARRS